MPKTRASSAAGTTYYGSDLPAFWGNTLTRVAFPNNAVYYSPVQVPHRCTATGVILVNGDVARAGNAYVALYDKNPANWQPLNRLAVSASTALNGIQRRQFIPFASSVTISSGLYFTAIIKSVTADDLLRSTSTVIDLSPAGWAGTCYWIQAMGGYLAPPVAATPVQTIVLNECVWTWLKITT